MFNRVLLIALTSAATCGLTTAAIAQDSRISTTEWKMGAETVISQADDNTSNPSAQQPSAAIQALQSRLQDLAYYDGPVTGVFDDATREALAQFQQEQGLVSTGILDPLTQQRLADPTGASSSPDTDATSPNESETDETSPEPNPSLELPPVSESGEALEPAAAPNEAEAEAAGEGTTADSSGEDASAQVDGDAAPPTEAVPAEDSRFPLLIVVGALILVFGGIAGGFTLWFSKRRGQDQSASDLQNDLDPTENLNPRAQSPRSGSPQVPPPPSQSVTGHSRNGKPPTSNQQQPPAALDIQHQSMPLGNVAEPRIAKVNIIDELIQDLQQPDPELRRRAIWELGQRGNSAAMQPLVNLLTQVDSQEQSLILAALAEITSQTLKPMNRAVMIALQSENSEVRKNAIRDLTKIFDSFKQSGKMLGHAAIDDDPDVRQTADWALDQLNKMRPSSPNTAGLLGESDTSQKRLADDGKSSDQ
ncbi:MAG: hypothetical protein F6K00_10950 [Leptolyngbya sp. SIOISBB]|nr:hypothetical protein [Leptolyngbya sp. SIOISBB]